MKACNCCNTIVGRLKRVCPSCKVPAIWRPLTEQEAADRAARNARNSKLLDEILAEIAAEKAATRTISEVAADKSWSF
jgi:hypothetical protein